MNRSTLRILLFALLFGSFTSAHALEQVLPEHLQQIEALQRRAENLAFGQAGPDNYHLAKARAWLDLAMSEYHEKDTTGALSAAISEAAALLDALESGKTDIPMDTPESIPGGEVVRTDLGERLSALKQKEHFACGQQPLATAEVYLVWAGHEFFESGISHAQSYIRSVENMLYDAEVAIRNCATTTQPSIPETITMSADALFAFGKSTLNPSAYGQLDKLAEHIKTIVSLEEVALVGHTDRMRSDGRPERNQILSEQRAESVKRYLIDKGIPADRIHASGAGSSQPLVQCSTRLSKSEQISCLQPNRRVEITLRGAKTESKGQPPQEKTYPPAVVKPE